MLPSRSPVQQLWDELTRTDPLRVEVEATRLSAEFGIFNHHSLGISPPRGRSPSYSPAESPSVLVPHLGRSPSYESPGPTVGSPPRGSRTSPTSTWPGRMMGRMMGRLLGLRSRTPPPLLWAVPGARIALEHLSISARLPPGGPAQASEARLPCSTPPCSASRLMALPP